MIQQGTGEIESILENYHMGTLAEMAGAAGLAARNGGRKLDKVALKDCLRAQFFTRERVLASLQRLDSHERVLLNLLLLRGSSAPTWGLRREAIRARLATQAEPPRQDSQVGYAYRPVDEVPYARGEYAGSPHRDGSAVFEDVIARLTYHGLVFSRYGDQIYPGSPPKLRFHPANVVYIPQVILQHLPAPQPLEAPAAAEPATVRSGEPALLLRDLYLYWDATRCTEVPLTKANLVAKRALRAINEQLLVPDPLLDDARSEAETGRLALLGSLLQALKLVEPQQGYLRPASSDPLHIPEFWSWSQEKQLATCLEAWPHLAGLNELGKEAAPYEPQYLLAREALLKVLKARPPERWLETENLLEQLRVENLDFLFAEHSRIQNNRDTWYYSYTSNHYYGQRTALLEILDRFEARFIECCLTGFLKQAGLLELGYEGERLAAVRLTRAGRALLGLAEAQAPAAQAPEEAGRIVIQPNFQLLAVGPVSLALLARLDLFADREHADRGAFDYRLSRQSVYRGQQLGMDAAEVIRFLQETCAVELPQNVRRTLEEWAAHHERIVFRSGVSLLQAATPDLLRELMASPETGSLLARAVAPDVALLAQGSEKALIGKLVQQELFPAVSGADPQSADRSVIVGEDGSIRPVHAVPSLHLRGRLVRLAEEGAPGQEQAGDGVWRLTPASVRRAGGTKPRVLRLLEELGRLHRGSLPAGVAERVKAWGGYYGDAAVQALTLIEFRDLETLDELLQHPALQPWLAPFPAGERALAAVPAEKLEAVRQILDGLGILVRQGL